MEAGTERHERALLNLRRQREDAANQMALVKAGEVSVARLAVLSGMSKSKAARLLGVSRPTLYAILDR